MKFVDKYLASNEQVVAIFIACYLVKKGIVLFYDCLLLQCCSVSLRKVCYCVYIALCECPLLFIGLYLVKVSAAVLMCIVLVSAHTN
jgi:hypothetical protein